MYGSGRRQSPVGAAVAVPEGPPPSTGGSTGGDVGFPAAGAGIAPLLLPPGVDAAVVGTLVVTPVVPPGWGVVDDWGAATGAGVDVGDRPPVVCWDDGARGPTVLLVPATIW